MDVVSDMVSLMRKFIDDHRALIEAPKPRVMEVGWYAAHQLAERAAPPYGPTLTPRHLDALFGVPVVERIELAPGAWRILDTADHVMSAGDLLGTAEATPPTRTL